MALNVKFLSTDTFPYQIWYRKLQYKASHNYNKHSRQKVVNWIWRCQIYYIYYIQHHSKILIVTLFRQEGPSRSNICTKCPFSIFSPQSSVWLIIRKVRTNYWMNWKADQNTNRLLAKPFKDIVITRHGNISLLLMLARPPKSVTMPFLCIWRRPFIAPAVLS